MSSKFKKVFNLSQGVDETGPIKLKLDYPFKCDGDVEIALNGGMIYNAYHNISAALGNNLISCTTPAGTVRTWTIPNGKYEAMNFIASFHEFARDNGDSTTTDGTTTYPVELTVDMAQGKFIAKLQNNARLNVSLSKINEWLGYNNVELTNISGGVIKIPSHNNPMVAKVFRVDVNIDGAEGIINQAGQATHSVFSIIPNVSNYVNFFADKPILNHNWFKLRLPYNNTIRELTATITDQDGNLLAFPGYPVMLELLIKNSTHT